MCSIFVYCNRIISTKRSNKVMIDNRYSKELQKEILNDEDIQYDNDDVENEYLKHLWDQKELFVVVLG